jgi:hypothetical protein
MTKGNLRSDNSGAIIELIFPANRRRKKNKRGINIVIVVTSSSTRDFSLFIKYE